MSSPETDYYFSSGRSSYSRQPDNLRTKKRRYEGTKEMTYGVDPYPHSRYKSYGNKNDRQEQLIVSNLPLHASDQVVKDGLFHEFKKFGHVSIYLRGRGEGRTAAISYRNPEDTIKVKQYHERRGKFIVFDRPVHIDYESEYERNSERGYSPEGYTSVSPRRNISKGGGRSFPPKEDFLREPPFDDGKMYRGRERGGNDFRDVARRYPYDDYREGGGIPVEDDPKASRTLFVGNLEQSITAQELRRVFEPYGHVEDVEIKRPTHPHGSTYAFVKFLDIDNAARAKAIVDGQYIGRNACKIGYGRSMPTTCLWVGGLGQWTSIDELTREFDRFGAIKFIDFPKGSNVAYILYDSLDAARVAARDMHGYPLGGPSRRLKIDFASADKGRNNIEFDHFNDFERHDVPYERNAGRGRGRNNWEDRGPRKYSDERNYPPRGERKWVDQKNGPFRERISRGGHPDEREFHLEHEMHSSELDRPIRRRGRSRSPLSDPHPRVARRSGSYRSHSKHSPASQRERSFSPDRKRDLVERMSPSPQRTKRNHSSSNEKEPVSSKKETVERDDSEKVLVVKEVVQKEENPPKQENGSDVNNKVESIVDVAKRFAVAWRGAFALKTSCFPLRMHLIGGNPELADSLLRAVGQGKILSISQRLRLDQPKLEEVTRRVTTAGVSGHCILLALPIAQTGWEDLDLDENFQQRPLRSLVVYLKQKQAAGVIPLPNNDVNAPTKDDGGILHAFPPCDYSHQQLLKVAPNLGPEPSKEDHLVIILVRGSG